MLPGVRILQRPRPLKSPEEALWPARGWGGYRNLAFRRDGKRVSEKRHVKMHGFGFKKKLQIARCFCPVRIRPKHPEFLPKATVRNNSPPAAWSQADRQAGGGEGWVGLGGGGLVAGWLAGGMVQAGWLAGMVQAG